MLSLMLGSCGVCTGTEFMVETFAGSDAGDPTLASGVPLKNAYGIALEQTGSLLVVDTFGHRVWRATPGGKVEVVAGTGVPGDAGDGGPAPQAQLNSPRDVAFGPNGSLFISDANNRSIRVVAQDGTIETIVPTPVGHAPDFVDPELLRNPSFIAYDADKHRLYVCETGQVRYLNDKNELLFFAGTGEIGLENTGLARTSTISPQGIAVGPDGSVYLSQFGKAVIWRVEDDKQISIAFDGRDQFVVDENGGVRWMAESGGLAFGPQDRLYFSDAAGGHVYRLEADGTVTPITPAAKEYPGGERGPIYFPYDLQVTAQEDIYVSQFSKGVVRRLRQGDIGEVVIGSPTHQGDGGPAVEARLFNPTDVTFDALGNLYIADRDNAVIRRVSQGGVIETFAGNGGRHANRSFEGRPPDRVSIGFVMQVKASSDGVYFLGNRVVRVVKPDRSVANVMTIRAGDRDIRLSAILPDGEGGLYIGDPTTHRVWRYDLEDSKLTDVAGNGEDGYPREGAPARETSIRAPQAMTLDPDGNLYFIDRVAEIRRVTPGGVLTTIAARPRPAPEGGEPIVLDLPQVDRPRGLAWGPDDALYVTDKTVVRRLERVGEGWSAETIAGTGQAGFSGDGGLALGAQFNDMWGLAFGPDGRLFVADRDNHRIRVLTPVE